ncbi:MAG: AtpZ/AtpI family protein [Myxococcales bacterium]|nr:AtpZ/AtpI family protein [Myxococcales bacterium]
MADRGRAFRRPDVRTRTQHDVERLRRREPGDRLWRSLTLVGSVGWPVVILAIGGALLGRHLDQRLDTGVHLTLILLTVGTLVGFGLALRSVRGEGRS